MATPFENKVLTFKQGWKGFDYAAMERELDEFGAQGWEVAGTLTPAIGSGHTLEVCVLLKRPRAT